MTYAATVAERINEARIEAIASLPRHDGLNWQAFAHVERFSPDQTRWAQARSTRLYKRQPSAAMRGLLLARQLRLSGYPEDFCGQAAGNLLVTGGLGLITNLLIGGTTAGSIKNAQAINGVGAGATAAAVGDTALTSNNTANAYYQQADATFPTQAGGVMTMQSTFASGNANFAWNEWCWASCTSGTITAGINLAAVATGVVMWNHKVPAASLGTKAAGAAWVFTTTITLS